MKISLNTPLSELPRIGKKYYKKFHKLGLNTVRDLIYHFPHRYQDFSNVIPIKKLELNQTATVQGKISEIEDSYTPRKRMLLTEAIIEDNTGSVKAIWFNQRYLSKTLKKGHRVSLSGKFKSGPDGPYLSNPSYERIFSTKSTIHTGGLIPIYPETAGITSRLIRYAIKLASPAISEIKEFLPFKITNEQKLLPLKTALNQIHFPKDERTAQKARKRLAFDELFLIQLSVIKQKRALQQHTAKSIPFDKQLVQKFVNRLPFQLTSDQKIAAWDILRDIAKPTPMNRLLNGDVGSGKTVVAAIAALQTASANLQVAFMAPTEILAEQHFNEFKKLLRKFNFKIDILTGSKKTLSKNTDIVIGTHALIQKGVKFHNLGLTIVDEQHRFGVQQRSVLAQGLKHQDHFPHFLTLTATPIPRTLALTVYGDLDISLLKQMPKGRQKIITKIVEPKERSQAYQFIKDQIKKGQQVFVICPLIEQSEKLEVKSVTQEYEKLNKQIFPDLNISMLHGKMSSKQKQEIMEEFKNKKTDILVSTSVVEVGIDIPNAAVMIIEGADRFGLAQLHQFRGRVGRGKHQSYCFLFTSRNTQTTKARLKALIDCENGFELAEKDLKIRGPGEVYGIRQSGIPDLAMASLGNIQLVEQTRKQANYLLDKDPDLNNYPLLDKKLADFRQRIHFE